MKHITMSMLKEAIDKSFKNLYEAYNGLAEDDDDDLSALLGQSIGGDDDDDLSSLLGQAIGGDDTTADPNAANAPAKDEYKGGEVDAKTWAPSIRYVYYEPYWEEGMQPYQVGVKLQNPNAATLDADTDDSGLKTSTSVRAVPTKPNGGVINIINGQEDENNEALKVGIDHIWQKHLVYLVNNLNNKFSDVMLAAATGKYTSGAKHGDKTSKYLKLIVYPGKVDEFKKILPQVADEIYSMSGMNPRGTKMFPDKAGLLNYSNDTKDAFVTTLLDKIQSAPSSKALQNRIINIYKNWKELMARFNDPATEQMFRGINGVVYVQSNTMQQPTGDINAGDGTRAGHQLSFNNKLEVFKQMPQAKFVTQAWVWRDFYGRQIKDGEENRGIIITKPNVNKTAKDEVTLDQAVRMCGFPSLEEYRRRALIRKGGADALSQAQKHAVEMQYNLLRPDQASFQAVIVYDISQTEPIIDANGNSLDKFGADVDLEDNLNGIPNQKAKERDRVYAELSGKTFNPATSVDRTDEENEELAKIVTALVSHEIGRTPKLTGNPGDDVTNCSFEYARVKGMKYAKTLLTDLYCNAFAACVTMSLGLKSDEAARMRAWVQNNVVNSSADASLPQTMINLAGDYHDFMEKINTEMKRKTYGLRNSVSNITEGSLPYQAPSVKIMSAEEICQFFGMDPSILNGANAQQQPQAQPQAQQQNVEGGYAVQNDMQTPEMVKESFYRLFDKIELL